MKIASFFSGAGGLDRGFEDAGFHVCYSNEYDKSIWDTCRFNFPNTTLDTRSIVCVRSDEVPDVDGFIGGPPCQSWSEAGAGRGIDDARGQLFYDYVRLLRDKQPKFFLAENVSGILHPKHANAFNNILKQFSDAGYDVNYKLLNAHDYEVPEDRLRVIVIGYRSDLGIRYRFPLPVVRKLYLRDAIGDLPDPLPAGPGNSANLQLDVQNHEYMTGGFSTIFMSRNRVRSWDEPSFTIQAGGRHAPIHPSAPKMLLVGKNQRVFVPGCEHLYRRLSVRECARIQTFPDDHRFIYNRVADGYKMVGNAVPVRFAYHLGVSILNDLTGVSRPYLDDAKNQNMVLNLA